MKAFKKLLVVLLAVLAAFSLFACGGDGETPENDGSGNSGGNSYSSTQIEGDETLLKENGYTVYAYTSFLENMESKMGIESGALKGYIFAYNDDGDGAYIYYFKSESSAKSYYDGIEENVKSAYTLKGNKLFLDDNTGLFD